MPLNPDDTLANGQYRILRLLGRGGFGFVYQASDTLIHRDVAIKELIPALVPGEGLDGDEATLKRFLIEARATLELAHESIVRTYNVFQEGGNYYIVMECMSGGSLEERLREKGSLPIDEAVRIAAQVCAGLDHAHRRGIVHCDLKPANILFTNSGAAKVADFGIAHVSDQMLSRSWMTPAGFVAGTLPYMSPEQTDGLRDDPRVDVYALGAVLYRMLTGKTYLDFDQRETPRAQAENVHRICEMCPDPPSAQNRRVPGWLDAVVLKALSKRPEERYDSASKMQAALQGQGEVAPKYLSVAAERAARASQASVKRPAGVWPAFGAAAVLLVLIAVALALLLAGGDDGGQTPTPQPTQVAVMEPSSTATVAPTHTLRPTITPKPPTDTPTPADTLNPVTETPVPSPTLVPPTATSRPTNTPAPPLPKAGATQTSPIDGAVMVYVPSGEFIMGSNDGEDDEKPEHTVYLDAFYIDKLEVTNDQFAVFLNAESNQQEGGTAWFDVGGEYVRIHQIDGSWEAKAGYGNHPLTEVTWYGARAYCAWAGKRLPTEAEWEKAARGTDARIYPWGNQVPDCSRANFRGGCLGNTGPVGSYPTGASPYGALDMVGNVQEWVSDWYGSYNIDPPTRNPPGPDAGSYKVLRGSSWVDWRQGDIRAVSRDRAAPGDSGNDFNHFGLRCVVSPGD